MKFRYLLKRIANLPRSLVFNLKVLGFKDGIKIPIYITHNCRILRAEKGSIVINAPLRRFMIEIGEGGSAGYPSRRGTLLIADGAKIIFDGKACFAEGTMLRVNEGGVMRFGDNFNSNTNCTFWCSDRIEIGKDVLLGFDIIVRDADGHKVFYKDRTNTISTAPISIGNHVWIAAKTSILKGTSLADDCVIGYNSCVMSNFSDSHLLIGGYPAKILRTDVHWEK